MKYQEQIMGAVKDFILSEDFKTLSLQLDFTANQEEFFTILDYAKAVSTLTAVETAIAMVRVFEGDDAADQMIEEMKFERIAVAEEHIQNCPQCKEQVDGAHQAH